MNKHAARHFSKYLAIAAVGCFCLAGATRAAEADWNACEGEGGDDARIAACTRIINDASVPAEERAGAHYVRGNVYGYKANYAQAITDYDKAIELNAKNAWYYASRCWALTEKGETDRAIADCDKAIALRPRNPQAFVNRGSAREAKAQTQLAIADYRAALAATAETDEDRAAQDDAKAALERVEKQSPK